MPGGGEFDIMQLSAREQREGAPVLTILYARAGQEVREELLERLGQSRHKIPAAATSSTYL